MVVAGAIYPHKTNNVRVQPFVDCDLKVVLCLGTLISTEIIRLAVNRYLLS